MIQPAKNKQGRNETCNCGSGKKVKKCCGLPDKLAVVTVRDMMKCLYLLLEGASEQPLGIPKGPIPFSKKMLDNVPENLINEIMIAENDKFLILTVKKKEESAIILPNKYLVKGPVKLKPF